MQHEYLEVADRAWKVRRASYVQRNEYEWWTYIINLYSDRAISRHTIPGDHKAIDITYERVPRFWTHICVEN